VSRVILLTKYLYLANNYLIDVTQINRLFDELSEEEGAWLALYPKLIFFSIKLVITFSIPFLFKTVLGKISDPSEHETLKSPAEAENETSVNIATNKTFIIPPMFLINQFKFF